MFEIADKREKLAHSQNRADLNAHQWEKAAQGRALDKYRQQWCWWETSSRGAQDADSGTRDPAASKALGLQMGQARSGSQCDAHIVYCTFS